MNPWVSDPLIEILKEEFKTRHRCHTLILYGSRARGEQTQTSDYDVIGFRKGGPEIRDARKIDGFYLDAFIYPEDQPAEHPDKFLYIQDGVVLFEKDDFGHKLLRQLNTKALEPVTLLTESEYNARAVWMDKMRDRAQVGDTEGNYRRVWWLTALLEDYFLMTGERYLGPKKSLLWLKERKPNLFSAYDRVLRPSASLHEFDLLIAQVSEDLKVTGKFQSTDNCETLSKKPHEPS